MQLKTYYIKKYMPNFTPPSHFISTVITRLPSAGTLTAYFRKRNISYTNFELFGMPVSMYSSPKLGHSNERVYCEPIDRRLKTLLNEESVSFLRQTTLETSNFL